MITYYAANKILAALTGRAQAASFTGNVYAGLSSTMPAPNGSNVTEPIGYGYSRVLIGNYNQSLTFKMTDPTSGTTTNLSNIFFGPAIANWGPLPYFVFYDASTGGNLLAYGTLTTPITPTEGTIPVITAGNMSITIDGM